MSILRPVMNRTASGSPIFFFESPMAQSLISVELTDESEEKIPMMDSYSPPSSTAFPAHLDIRRSLSPILDFNRGGERRNFCNIGECSFCRPLVDNHRLSPLRSPVISPSSRSFISFLSLSDDGLSTQFRD